MNAQWLRYLSLCWSALFCAICLANSHQHSALPSDKTPRQVAVGVFIFEIRKIDVKKNEFEIEGKMELSWMAPELSNPTLAKGNSTEISYSDDKLADITKTIWWPDMHFIDQVTHRNTQHRKLIIASTGQVTYKERFDVVLHKIFNLHRFPFDEHQLKIRLASFAWDSEHLLLTNSHHFNQLPELELSEWQVADMTPSIQAYNSYHGHSYSQFLLAIHIKRYAQYYIWKIIFPIVIIVLLALSVFLIPIHNISDRLQFSLVSLLTVTAFQFSVSKMMPKMNYFTYLDWLLSTSFNVIFFAQLCCIFIIMAKKCFNYKLQRIIKINYALLAICILLYFTGIAIPIWLPEFCDYLQSLFT